MTGASRPLLSCFLPQLAAGGAERVVLAVAGELAARGYRCDLVTARRGGRWSGRIPDGVRAVSFDRRKPLYALTDLVGYLRRERPAAVLSSVFSANLTASAACWITGTRCVLREAFWAGEDAKSARRLARLGNHAALRLLYRHADAIVALSRDLAAHVRVSTGIAAERIVVIPNPHIVETAPELPVERDPQLILACGRLEPQKDFLALLEAFALLLQERPARLVVLGEGSQRAQLEQRAIDLGIGGAVRFAGYSDNVGAWMRQAKVFVSTSRSEGFPNVLLEALACGCEIVSTRSSDAVWDILGNDLGRIVEVGDGPAIAAALSLAMQSVSDPALGRRSVQRRFDLQTITDRYLDVLLPSPEARP